MRPPCAWACRLQRPNTALRRPARAPIPAAPPKPKPPTKLGAEKLTPQEQRRRFIEAAPEAGATWDEADFHAALKRIATPKVVELKK